MKRSHTDDAVADDGLDGPAGGVPVPGLQKLLAEPSETSAAAVLQSSLDTQPMVSVLEPEIDTQPMVSVREEIILLHSGTIILVPVREVDTQIE